MDEIKDQTEIISGNKPTKYGKDFMKIKFQSDDKLPLSTILNIPVCIIATIIIHKFIYMNVHMSVNIKIKMIFIPLHK